MNDRNLLQQLHPLLSCPVCRDSRLTGWPIVDANGKVVCDQCHREYSIRDGIAILLPDSGGEASAQKQNQVEFFDKSVDAEFEITRPRGLPQAHTWLLNEKLRRGTRNIPLDGAIVANICSGSGMDAEFLCRLGAVVIAVDISEGAVRRALERAARYNLDFLGVVGDAEHLPIRSQAVDVAFVHDGLHHLPDPLQGVNELGRIARYAISINEPASALLTRVAVLLNLSEDKEDAGNEIARLVPKEVENELRRTGFEPEAQRYAMYYKHEPGRILQLASSPATFPIFVWTMRVINFLLGRIGNKISIVGFRR